ncbi:MAG: hypothetical protein LBI28_04020, partial [Treponema sp.]|nr:hypothetical protein [Treponema sp.]
YAEIDNITLSGNFSYTSDGRIHLGGIAGTINQTGTVVKNSTSSLTMNINPAGSGTPAPVNGGTGQHWIGGFVGLFHNGAGIEKCHNSGNITVDNVARSGGQVYAGGISGGSYYGMSSSNYSGYIQDSSYTGNITVSNTGNWTFAAGIAGTIVGGSSATVNSTRIERCFVTGTVSCENTSAGFPYVGGIVAYNYYGALVSQCYFTGTVIQKGRALGQYTGCIAGYNSQAAAPTNSRIEDCWSSGKISVTTYDINNLSGPQLAGATSSRCYVIQIFSDGSYRGATGGDSSCFTIDPTAKPTQSEYTSLSWNFTTVWKWDSVSGYPKLQWQN